MIICEAEQGSVEWQMDRLGIPTASNFDKIITPKTMKPSASAEKYAYALIAEQILQQPMEGGSSAFTERGSLIERRARTFYELKHDVDVQQVGFCLRDDRRVGCSPDGFVGEDGLIEIKCPTPGVHVGYLLDDEGLGYKCQVQGQLWITGRKWVDTLSFHPDLPPAEVRILRDEKFILALEQAVAQFLSMIDEAKVKLQKHGLFEGFELAGLRVA